MKIYILELITPYEGSSILGVYENRFKAEQVCCRVNRIVHNRQEIELEDEIKSNPSIRKLLDFARIREFNTRSDAH